MSGAADFAAAILDTLGRGPDPGKITSDRFIRFPLSDRRGDDSGWCFMFADGDGGTFGDWRTGALHTWQSRKPTTPEERAAFAEKVKAARKVTAKVEEQERAEARRKATDILKKSDPPTDNPYLLRKQVQSVETLREISVEQAAEILNYHPTMKGEKLTGKILLVPVKINGQLSTLELIDGAGRKAAIKGRGTKKGGFWVAQRMPEGDGNGLTITIGEGVSTVLSVVQITGYLGVAALTCSNFPAVAQEMHTRYPSARLIILSDLGNGQKDAEAAARAVRGLLAIPTFADLAGNPTDFNDLACLEGPEKVKEIIEAATALEPIGTVTTGADPYPWGDPSPLPDNLPPVKPLYPDMLPLSLRAWLFDIAERMQVPPDFPAAAAIVALSSVIGRGCGIYPKVYDDWLVVPNLWGGIVGRPSLMKSPSMSEALKPLYRLVHDADQEHNDAQTRHEVTGRVSKMKREVMETKLKEALKKNQAQAAAQIEEQLQQMESEPAPVHRRYITSDPTIEKVAEILKANPRGLLINRDELIGWFRSLDKHGREADRGFYLEAWNGTASNTSDRISRGTLTASLCLSIFGAITPGALSEYVYQATRGGAGDDGLLQRFQVMVYPDPPATWENIDRKPDHQAKRHAFHVFKKLAAGEGFPEIEEGEDLPALHFTEGAQVLFNEWRQEEEQRLRSGDIPPVMESHLGKFRSLMPSLALIFHLVTVADGATAGSVTEEAALMALAWCDYLESHAWRIYGAGTSPGMETAREIVKRIFRGDIRDGDTIRDVSRHHWSKLTTPEEVKAGLNILIDYDWLVVDPVKSGRDDGRGRPSEIIRLNPNIKRKND